MFRFCKVGKSTLESLLNSEQQRSPALHLSSFDCGLALPRAKYVHVPKEANAMEKGIEDNGLSNCLLAAAIQYSSQIPD